MNTRIRALREDRNLTQTQVAEALGISQRKYSYLETGVQPWTDELVMRLAGFYQTSIDYLLERTDERKPYPAKKK